MLSPALLSTTLYPWTDGTAPLVGVVAAGLALLIGYWAAQRRGRYAGMPLPARTVDPYTFGSATERRDSFRRKGAYVKVDLADAAGKEVLGAAWVLNRSAGGLRLQVEQAFEAGSIISVRPVHATNGMPWVQAEVKCCKRQGDEWEIGCQFLRRPSWSMMLLFG